MYENMIHLYQKTTQLNVLSLFLDSPFTGFYLRESARLLKMDPMTVKRSLDILVADGLLEKVFEKNMILYKANIENPVLRHQKIAYDLSKFQENGLVDLLLKKFNTVSSIVLFGSFAKGESDKDSDVDLVIISLSKTKPTTQLSKLLGRDVNIMNFTPAEWSQQSNTNRAFYLDVITEGIVLYGNRPVIG